MALLNFKKQFVEPIRQGTKYHTIRAMRKNPVKQGEKLYLYCGCRQKGAFRILPEPQVCTLVQSISIKIDETGVSIHLGGVALSQDERCRLANADGFECSLDFYEFWEKNHGDKNGVVDFTGQIIHWR